MFRNWLSLLAVSNLAATGGAFLVHAAMILALVGAGIGVALITPGVWLFGSIGLYLRTGHNAHTVVQREQSVVQRGEVRLR